MSHDTALRLLPNDPRLAEAIDAGRLDGLAVRPIDAGDDGIVFEAFVPDPAPSAAAIWWRAVRAYSFTATLTPAVLSLALLKVLGERTNVALAACAIAAALVMHVGVNLLNDAEDHRRVLDLPGGPGGAGIIQRGWLSARSVRRAAYAAFALAIVLGLPVVAAAPPSLFVLGAVSVVLAFAYSGGPYGLKYHGLGDLAVLALCGPMLTAAFVLSFGASVRASTVALGLVVGFGAVGILHVNNWQDRESDARRGVRTMALWLGEGGSWSYAVAVYALAYASVVGLAIALALETGSVASGLGVGIAGLVSIPAVRAVFSAVLADPRDVRLRELAAKAHLALGASVLGGLIATLVLRMF